MDFTSRKSSFALAGFILLASVWIVWLLLYHLTPGNPEQGSTNGTLYVLGFVLGCLFATFLMLGALSGEAKRFEQQIKQSGPDDRIRPPFSPYKITKQEFRKMWGDDNPDTFDPRKKS